MTTGVNITLPGLPRGKGRPRFSVRGGVARAYTDEKTASFEGALRLAGKQAMGDRVPYDGPVTVTMHAVFPIPKSWSRSKWLAASKGEIRPTGKPDVDNIMKASADSLNGIVWNDDAQIVRATVSKHYGTEPELVIQVREWVE